MIDINEAGCELEHNNHKHRKTSKTLRVDDEGVYNRDTETNLLLAICCDEQYNLIGMKFGGRRDHFCTIYHFLEQIITQLNKNHPG